MWILPSDIESKFGGYTKLVLRQKEDMEHYYVYGLF
jgi:hypothetical protein